MKDHHRQVAHACFQEPEGPKPESIAAVCDIVTPRTWNVECLSLSPGKVLLRPDLQAALYLPVTGDMLVEIPGRHELVRATLAGEISLVHGLSPHGVSPAPGATEAVRVICVGSPLSMTGSRNTEALLSLVLPPLIHVPRAAPSLQKVVELLESLAESKEAAAGLKSDTAHLLVRETMRRALDEAAPFETAWLKGLSDPDLGPILTQMLERPSAPWTLVSLSNLGLMSRSKFAACFRSLMGTTPMDLLLRIRMQRAIQLLQENREDIKQIARRCGYRSLSAFTAAFHRHVGCPPSEFRSVHRGFSGHAVRTEP